LAYFCFLLSEFLLFFTLSVLIVRFQLSAFLISAFLLAALYFLTLTYADYIRNYLQN